MSKAPIQDEGLFENPFVIEDLQVFDDTTLRTMLANESFGMDIEQLGLSLHGASRELIGRITHTLLPRQRARLKEALRRPASSRALAQARRSILDRLFWELTYWKTPELYEELTEGERLHPGIFQQLAPDITGKLVLDAGAGSGRASFECLHYGARQIYAVEPSPGLLTLLEKKLVVHANTERIIPLRGRFDSLPLPARSVDIALSCSAFTADPEQGGERGLQEMQRVTKPGGKLVLVWPRIEDRAWLLERGFSYVSLPIDDDMHVRFHSMQSALECARRFYARNREVVRYLITRQKPEVPFSVLGLNPPHEYCWLSCS